MFKNIDLFGRQINLRFNKKQTYQSNFGSFVTLIIVSFVSYRFISMIFDAIHGLAPQVNYSERQVDDPAVFQTNSLSYPIAFAMEDPNTKNYYIDESIYTVSALIQSKYLIYNSKLGQNTTVWDIQNVTLQPCTVQNFQNPQNKRYYLSLNYTNMYCLSPETNFSIQGDFNSPIYSQIQFFVQKCQINCKSEEEINYYLMRSAIGIQLSDAYVDVNQYENPFQIFSRDLFFQASLLMPSDAIIYIRNNYVYSNKGFIQTDTNIQKYPQFSFYETSVFPPNTQSYFFSFRIRFEKQKESLYQRKYKDLLSIMSEIGGLTQSFLAIGFLICRYISQIQLNQNIIKQIFKYEELEESFQQQEEDVSIKQNKTKLNQQKLENSQNIQFDVTIDKDNKTFLSNASIIKLNKNKSQLNSDIQFAHQEKQNKNASNEVKWKTLDYSKSSQNEIKDNNSCNIYGQKKSIFRNIQRSQSQKFIQDNKNILPQNHEQKQFLNSLLQKNKSYELNSQNTTSQICNKKKQEKQFGDELKENNIKKKKKMTKDIDKLLQKQTKSMEIGFWQYLISYICPFGRLKKKKQIIDYSIDKLYENLDILQILKRLIEVEKLKRLFLDQDQIKLFDYLPKPTINFGFTQNLQEQTQHQDAFQNQEINLLYQDGRSEFQKIKDAYEAYKNILAKKDFSNLDQKIIDMIDQNIVDIFEVQDLNITEVQIPKQLNVYDQQMQDVFQNTPQSIKSDQFKVYHSTDIRQFKFPKCDTSISIQQSQNFQNSQDKAIQMLFQNDQIPNISNSCKLDMIINDNQSSQGEIAKEDFNNNLPNQIKDITFLNPFIDQKKN
ncbi:hypothetical protein ABPG74_013723 [Tetrahymena malaccensis]